jgi:hypothetical protein
MAWITPKTDWIINPKRPDASDFSRIEGNIAFLQSDIEVKKELIVNAVNTKRVTVDTSMTFQEIADVIETINLNYRKANGTATLTQTSSNVLTLQVTGLNFQPSNVCIRGSFNAFFGTLEGNPVWLEYKYAIVDSVFTPTSSTVSWIGSASANANVTYQSDGFTITITGSGSLQPGSYSQYWFAYE